MKLCLVLLSLTVMSCAAAGIREERFIGREIDSWLYDLVETRREDGRDKELKTMTYNPPGCKGEGGSCRRSCDCCGPTSSCDSWHLKCFATSSSYSANLQCYGKVVTCDMKPEAYCPGQSEPWGWWKMFRKVQDSQ